MCIVGSSCSNSFKGSLSDICLLLWKNFKIQLRHPYQSLVELLLPCLLVFILALFRRSVDVGVQRDPVIYRPFNLTDFETYNQSNQIIMFTPINNDIMQIMNETVSMLTNDLPNISFTALPFKNSEDMMDYYLKTDHPDKDRQIWCGIEFLQLENNVINFTLRFPSVPRHYKKHAYRKSWETDHIMPELVPPGPRDYSKNDGGKPGYAREGFLLVQHCLTLAIAKVLQTEPIEMNEQTKFKMIRFPFPPFISDIYLYALSFLFPAVVVFSFTYSSVNLTKNLVIEKEKRLKESMKMMGLKEKYHWIAYFIKSLIWTMPSMIILVLLLFINIKDKIAILNFSNPIVLFLFFLFYEISNICQCFMLSTFFSHANLAGIVTGVIFFFTFLPFFTVVAQYSSVATGFKLLLCLLPNTNMAFGIYIITMKESRGVGMDWKHLNMPAVANDRLTLLIIVSIKLINSCIYLLITWYMTQAFPGKYGVSLPWYFPFTKSYWFGSNEPYHVQDATQLKNVNEVNDVIEREPKHLKTGIKIQNMSKTYNGNTFSVSNLNLNIYQKQITALLGHNGAGKTTTISILTGLFKPTGGTAFVNGFDIRTNMDNVRASLGICPQFNILFDELTVEEHLKFYCKLKRKDMSSTKLKNEIETMIEKLDLIDKRNVQSCNLSGGMKRKLSVGIALIGDSKVVILDEPTSGMDVSARRFIWDLLLVEKKYRSILISTHFMEEADILGDRIAIMADGKLQCCGSPLFLKRKFGAGYHLTIAKSGPEIKTEEVTNIVQQYISDARLESSAGIEVTYSLSDDDTKLFEPLLQRLEDDHKLPISNYGISVTTMEEVFLKVGEYAKNKIESITHSINPKEYVQNHLNVKNQGCLLLFQQLYALISKKILYSMRSPFLTMSQLTIPFFVLNMTMLSLRAIPRLKESPRLHMSLSQFDTPFVKYYYDTNSRQLADKYEKVLEDNIIATNRIQGFEYGTINPLIIGLDIVKTDITTYNYDFMVSSVISSDGMGNHTILALFNNQAYHTPSISLKLVDEAYIRYKYNLTDISVTVTNHPLPMTATENRMFSVLSAQTQFEVMQGLILALSFLAGSFAVLAVKERITKGKHLQRLSGVRASVFWLSYFITDYTIYLVSSFLMVLAFIIHNEEGLSNENQPFYLSVGFIIHGLAILPCVYALSFVFTTPSTAYARLCLYVLVIGVATFITDQITSVKELGLLDKNRILKPIFGLFVPVYDLGKIGKNLITNFEGNRICQKYSNACEMDSPPEQILACCKEKCGNNCIPFEKNYFSLDEPGIGIYALYLLASSLFYIIILALIEMNLTRTLENWINYVKFKFTYVLKPKKNFGNQIDFPDNDVVAENQRIIKLDPTKDGQINSLIVRNLKKKYGDFVAVDGISYCVEKGECFGMLGVNGAGKTTTFKMITGDESITSGEIFVNRLSIKKNLREAQQEMGYCPQFDAMLDDLTGRETLTMYSRLRGIKESDIESQIEELSHLLYFEMHVDKLVKEYSGGNKRKLSTAIALLGNPTISFLDEPTTGVDPVARRCLWQAIGNKLKQGCSMVLTSHSMEECEALCKRLVIMVNGQICCIGSPLQLKNKFGNGYTLLIRVSPSEEVATLDGGSIRKATKDGLRQNLESVQQFVQEKFPSSILKAIHNNLLHYTIENTINWQVKCSQIFGAIEKARANLQIEDYSVCQTNLEQIFLSFARQQREEEKLNNQQNHIINS